MLWVQSIAFTHEPYAEGFLNKSVDLFTSIENIDEDFQRFLHLSHKIMIKYYIEDKTEERRLLKMITQTINKTQIDEVVGFEKELNGRDRLLEHLKLKNKQKNVK